MVKKLILEFYLLNNIFFKIKKIFKFYMNKWFWMRDLNIFNYRNIFYFFYVYLSVCRLLKNVLKMGLGI